MKLEQMTNVFKKNFLCFLLKIKLLFKLKPKEPISSWRRLGYVILTKGILEEIITKNRDRKLSGLIKVVGPQIKLFGFGFWHFGLGKRRFFLVV